ncbi:MAG: hypothetical protein R3B13_08875 [Polyangiaceae bacterium]
MHDDEKSEKIRPARRQNVADDDQEQDSKELDPNEQTVALLREIRELIVVSSEQQARYLWILFPIIGILLIQTILMATNL